MTERGDTSVLKGVTPASPKPSENRKEPSVNTSASKSRKLPLIEQFPEYLVGIDPQVLADWEALRKEKRAPISVTVLAGLANKARLGNMQLADVLRIMVEKNWQGFELKWLDDNMQDRRYKQVQQAGLMTGAIPTDKHRGFDVGTYLEDATDGRIPD